MAENTNGEQRDCIIEQRSRPKRELVGVSRCPGARLLTNEAPVSVGAAAVQQNVNTGLPGLPDLLVANQPNFIGSESGVYGPLLDFENDGTGNYLGAVYDSFTDPIATPTSLAAGDLNDDGYGDVAMVDIHGIVSVFLNGKIIIPA